MSEPTKNPITLDTNPPVRRKPGRKPVPQVATPPAKRTRQARVLMPAEAAFKAKQQNERTEFKVPQNSEKIRLNIETKWLPRMTRASREKLLDTLSHMATVALPGILPEPNIVLSAGGE